MSGTEFKLNPVETRVGKIALVTVDNGEDYRKPTTLGSSAFESAVAVIDALESGDWAAMVLTGKPFVFCVGADVDEFSRIESREQALAGSRAGHALFSRIRALPFPTVAAINGACLGGGLELALHCDARTIAANVRHVGFPEVALSIIPGWGGTQLAPKLAGPDAAVKLIVLNPLRQNRLIAAPDAVELGIADRLLAPVEFVDESLAYAVELVEQGGVERAEPDWSEAETILRKARARVEDALHGATRAPSVALDLIEAARDLPLEEGYAAEEEAMADLMTSPQAQAAVYAFTVVERRSKRSPVPDTKPRRVEKVGIVGAGLMATQLATLFLRKLKVPVVLRDLEQSRVDEALATIRDEVSARDPFLATIVDGGTGWEQFAGCDLVLEAVFEELEVKRAVFAEVRKVAPEAILATNTSSLSVEAMGADVGLHFFNPVAVLPLVEVVRTPATTDEQLATAWDVVGKLGKRGVLVSDAPAFVVNRVLTRMTAVLMDALEHGNTVEETDEAALTLGLPMAPSVLLQMVGPRVANHVLETLHASYPDRFPLSPTLANYADGTEEIVLRGDAPRSVDEIREACLEAIADEVRSLLDEGVVAAAADVDACLILGAGYPFHLGGITKHLDQTGVSERVLGSALADYASAATPA
ncbi:MAG TPA: 3-hydroxyacyl-CoA dehydrogenase NAD-binding domain-containing protein [Gaiellaceae bacterium]|nr:3-hydroxyacyl-CoA dehydrogenase NAD-binding domain-containing protein [Gaiellaceae bacterium]